MSTRLSNDVGKWSHWRTRQVTLWILFQDSTRSFLYDSLRFPIRMSNQIKHNTTRAESCWRVLDRSPVASNLLAIEKGAGVFVPAHDTKMRVSHSPFVFMTRALRHFQHNINIIVSVMWMLSLFDRKLQFPSLSSVSPCHHLPVHPFPPARSVAFRNNLPQFRMPAHGWLSDWFWGFGLVWRFC